MHKPSRSGIDALDRTGIDPSALSLVAVGGALGAGARWALVEMLPTAGDFPWWTLAVNVAGCLLLGLLLGVSERARLALGVGVCGGLTTFSAVAVESATLLEDGALLLAGAYLASSLAAGAAAVILGWRLAPGGRIETTAEAP